MNSGLLSPFVALALLCCPGIPLADGNNSAAERISLDGTWELSYGMDDASAPESPEALSKSGWPSIPASVPGNVELDLVRAGLLDDPSKGNRIYDLRKWEPMQWWYGTRFKSPPRSGNGRVLLVFEGLDCIGTVWLNGEAIGHAENMLIPHRFDVTEKLSPSGENRLAVRIRSAVLEGRRIPRDPLGTEDGAKGESVNVRKAPHMWGWDILPRAVSAGLWRSVYLESLPPTHWRSVYWATKSVDVERRTADMVLDWDFATDLPSVDRMRIRATLEKNGEVRCQSEAAVISTHGKMRIRIDNADLWWPRGYGEASLYDASVRLIDPLGRVLDENRCRVGARTVELLRTDVTLPDAPGEFQFRVNGEKIFVKGTNWVPLDALHSRDLRHLAGTFDMLVDLNCNMVRCWGGNVYEDHPFFDLCDANGVMVWQDFAMACTVYPQTVAFAAKIREEAESVIARLRNHPSLALWAGNNEIDASFYWEGDLSAVDPNTDRISRQVLPETVRRLDPLRPYLPSSPYYSPEAVRLGAHERLLPEVHLWGPRGYFKDAFYTSDVHAHFVSEIGYHGCPCRESLEAMMDPAFVHPWTADGRWNDQWLTKSVRFHPDATNTAGRNDLMARQIRSLFGDVPRDLDGFIRASQVTQAEALKFFIESWRQRKWRRTGILWWNLRDGWPVLSDAVVDYYGRKKLAYETIRRSQTDVCAMFGENENGGHELLIVNDTRQAVSGTVRVRDAEDGRLLLETPFRIDANGKTSAGSVKHPDKSSLWLIHMELPDKRSLDQKSYDRRSIDFGSYDNHYLAGSPPFRLEDVLRWLGKTGITGKHAF